MSAGGGPPTGGAAHAGLVVRLRAAGCVFAEEEATLLLEAGRGDPVRLRGLVQRRMSGEPLEYVLGWADFGGLRLRVREGVFVPRLRTMAVVRAAEALLAPGATVVDLCCGVGAIGAALLRDVGPLELVASDIDPDAVEVARENLGDHGVVVQGDLFDPLPSRYRGAVDLVAVNAPYVPTGEIERMPREAREHEHVVALDGGEDGLALHRRIAAAAAEWLRSGGSVVIETSRRQAPVTASLFAAAGLDVRVVTDDEVDGTAVVATAS